ncbi:MAG: hypothetical protein VX834_13145 [Myxococcota bacterium]|nr:hypothetical protein [Myxococcota bacterium]
MRIESPITVPSTGQWHPDPTQSESLNIPALPILPTASESPWPTAGPKIVEPSDVRISLKQKVAVVLERAGVGELVTVIDEDAVVAQAKTPGNKVSFEKALADALTSFLTDDDDIESPLSLMSDGYDYPGEQLIEFFNDGSTKLQLVNSDMMDAEGGAYPAEHGESIADHWVFALSIPQYSDHLYWAIVPRDGEPAYNYGFN